MTKAKQRSIKTKQQQQKKKHRAKARLFLDKIFHRIKLKYKADIEKKMMIITIFVYHCPLLVGVPVLKNKFKKRRKSKYEWEKNLYIDSK